jgi:hypothetical protein
MSDIQNKIEALKKAVANIHTKVAGPPIPIPPNVKGCCTIEFNGRIIILGPSDTNGCQGEGLVFYPGKSCDEVPGGIYPTPNPNPNPKPGLPFRN